MAPRGMPLTSFIRQSRSSLTAARMRPSSTIAAPLSVSTSIPRTFIGNYQLLFSKPNPFEVKRLPTQSGGGQPHFRVS